MMLPFHKALKKLILEAFSGRETSPDQVARHLAKAMLRPCGKAEGEALSVWLEERKIVRLVHFTPLANVPAIIQFGLIAREYLQLEVIKLAIGPNFTDHHRLDEQPWYSCLSITSPNYAMFFNKRSSLKGEWAVIEFDAKVLTRLYFSFSPTNAAAEGVMAIGGVKGAERLFLLPKYRFELGLLPCEPTDPQAEALCDSILPPSYVRGVYVESAASAAWLRRRGIESVVDNRHFLQRRDWKFWRGRRITDLPEARQQLSI